MKLHKILQAENGEHYAAISGVKGKWGADISRFVEKDCQLQTKRFSHENGHRLIFTHGGRFDLEGECQRKFVLVSIATN